MCTTISLSGSTSTHHLPVCTLSFTSLTLQYLRNLGENLKYREELNSGRYRLGDKVNTQRIDFADTVKGSQFLLDRRGVAFLVIDDERHLHAGHDQRRLAAGDPLGETARG